MKKVYVLLSCMDNGESNEWHQLSELTAGVYSSLELAVQRASEDFALIESSYWKSKHTSFRDNDPSHTWFEIHEYILDDMGA